MKTQTNPVEKNNCKLTFPCPNPNCPTHYPKTVVEELIEEKLTSTPKNSNLVKEGDIARQIKLALINSGLINEDGWISTGSESGDFNDEYEQAIIGLSKVVSDEKQKSFEEGKMEVVMEIEEGCFSDVDVQWNWKTLRQKLQMLKEK